MIGWAVKMLAIWGGVGLLLYAFVGHRLVAPSEGTGAAPVAASVPASSRAPGPERQRSASPNTLVYRADKSGHVFLDGVVNGSSVRFMLDTGATMVALTIQDAAAAGISRGSLNFTQTVSTASGTARVAPVKLREVRIGQFSATDVPAAVVENLQMSLLGQTFLKRLASYEMRDGVLTMYWN
jgi:aspartyl protease family protein